MAFLDVVFRALNKAGDAFIELRREDGHGSSVALPSHVNDAQLVDVVAALNRIDANTDTLEISAESINLNTDTLEQGQADILSRLNLTLNVADDYQTGEILPDQTGNGGVLTFTFSQPVQNIWVYAVNPLDLTANGEVRVDPFGGTPSAALGIPVGFGGITPIPVTGTIIKVFAPLGSRVTVYGNRRS